MWIIGYLFHIFQRLEKPLPAGILNHSMRTAKTIAWVLLAANTAVIVLFWWQGSGTFLPLSGASGQPAIAWGRLAGLLLEYALLLQLVLIGRMPWIEQLFGHDALNRLHRWVGYTLIVLVVAHPLLVSIGYGALQRQTTANAFAGLLTRWPDVFNAFIAVILLLAVIMLSVPWVRRRVPYHSWHALHLLTYVAVLFAFGHQGTGHDLRQHSAFMYWLVLNFTVFGAYFAYRFFRPLWFMVRHRFVVERVVQESDDVWSVYITGRRLDAFHFRGGQFANLHFLTRALWKPHPFSFSREYDGHTLRFTIRALGDDTVRIAHLRPGTRAIIDGPLGIFTANRARTGKYLLIAGGIGVTPIRAMAGELSGAGADVQVFCMARTVSGAALLSELERLAPVHLFLSRQTDHLPLNARHGQFTVADISRLVPDVRSRDTFICGPGPMMRATAAALASLGVPKTQIHYEQFGY